jgi:hypothetical protein
MEEDAPDEDTTDSSELLTKAAERIKSANERLAQMQSDLADERKQRVALETEQLSTKQELADQQAKAKADEKAATAARLATAKNLRAVRSKVLMDLLADDGLAVPAVADKSDEFARLGQETAMFDALIKNQETTKQTKLAMQAHGTQLKRHRADLAASDRNFGGNAPNHAMAVNADGEGGTYQGLSNKRSFDVNEQLLAHYNNHKYHESAANLEDMYHELACQAKSGVQKVNASADERYKVGRVSVIPRGNNEIGLDLLGATSSMYTERMGQSLRVPSNADYTRWHAKSNAATGSKSAHDIRQAIRNDGY